MRFLSLSASIGPISKVSVKAIYPGDGATGSLTFTAHDAAGSIVGEADRGAAFPALPDEVVPTEVEVLAAITAALS